MLARRFRDISLAEEAVQDAVVRALETWPVRGIPERPAAWLFTVARRRVLDVRRQRQHDAEIPDTLEAPDVARDDRVQLLFACCHPAIAPRSQVGLALRTLCGLTTEQVARAFVETVPATARRLTRASNKIRDAGVPFRVPGPLERPQRVAAVIASIYLLFTEGYAPTHAEQPVRPSVCARAIELGEQVAALLPDEPEIGGALALMRLHHARRDGRVDSEGRPVPLDRQRRDLWHREEIAIGSKTLEAALSRGRPGPYQIQGAIAALHAQAKTPQDTDWDQITALYGALLTHTPTPIVELNAAVALAMSAGPERGLAWLDGLVERGVLSGYHLLHAARADLLERVGDPDAARTAFERALTLATSPSDRRVLTDRMEGLPSTRRRRRRDIAGARRVNLSDRDWRRLRALFPTPGRRGRGRPRRPDREVLHAVLWVLGTGQPWRELPHKFGPWQTAYHRFRTWENDGTLHHVAQRLAAHPTAPALQWMLARTIP